MSDEIEDLLKETKKSVSIEIGFHGNGKIIRRDNSYYGGVDFDESVESIPFSVHREYLGDDGIWNPGSLESSVEGGFQINVWGSSQEYRELGRLFLALAELDVSEADDDYHVHLEPLMSRDGRTRLHLILRKPVVEEQDNQASDRTGNQGDR